MGNIIPPDTILLWCPIGNVQNTATNGLVDQSTGYSILEPYQNTGVWYTGEIGVRVQLDTGIDLTWSTSVSINVLLPNGSTEVWTGGVVGLNEVNSVIQYITQAGDLYYPGTYSVQPAVTFSNWSGFGEKATFTICENIQ